MKRKVTGEAGRTERQKRWKRQNGREREREEVTGEPEKENYEHKIETKETIY